MRFLADESCDAAVWRALAKAGYEVLAVCKHCSGASDETVAALALEERRILLTEDKDFGRLVFAHGRGHCGVMFLRYPLSARRLMADAVVEFVRDGQRDLAKVFVVFEPGKVRVISLFDEAGE